MKIINSSLSIALCFTCLFGSLSATPKKKDSNSSEAEPTKSKDVLKNAIKKEGLFDFYQDTLNGSAYMAIREDQIGKEFIYFSYTENGVLAVGHFRGQFRENKIFSVQKVYDRIEIVQENGGYYFNPDNALSKAAKANINRPILTSSEIIKDHKVKGEYLIKADHLFLTENLHQVKRTPPSDPSKNKSFQLGKLSKEKTKYLDIRPYPENVDIITQYVYDNPTPRGRGGEEMTNPRYVSLKLQHSIIAMPDNDFNARKDDSRMGYFMHKITDMTSVSATPYRDIIHRWHLEKKDKNAALSEPVKPIIWWIENTTPMEYRQTIKEALLNWNSAFEKAGFKNAVQVKVQPDTATWNAGDIRYNVLRWTSSPTPPFGGYGPSFVNPRTGQILGADIMLEFAFLTNRLQFEKYFDRTALGIVDEVNLYGEEHSCLASYHMHMNNLFGQATQNLKGADDASSEEMLMESLSYLILHEVGHTLGLMHNMKASNLHSVEEINNKELTSKIGLTGSVMDYPAINISYNEEDQGQYYTTIPGPYDHWAIEYGYSERLSDPGQEAERLNKILLRSDEQELAFGNDADDMRSPGHGIDPRVMIFDLTSDPVEFFKQRLKLTKELLPKLEERFSVNGQSYHELRNAYMVLTGQTSVAAMVVSRFIGGIYVDRSHPEQNSDAKPFSPVEKARQKRAMEMLREYVFAPNAFQADLGIYNYLQLQRRGFGHPKDNEDPKIHDRVLHIQENALNHLLHDRVMKRIIDSGVYGNAYRLDEVLSDLSKSIFEDDLNKPVNTFRQNLQQMYVSKLIKIFDNKSGKHGSISQSVVMYELDVILKQLKRSQSSDRLTKAHRFKMIHDINKAFDVGDS